MDNIDSAFNIENVVKLLQEIHRDLRPAEWVLDNESPHGGRFEERNLDRFENPVEKPKRTKWVHDYTSTGEKHGILACSDGYFTFVPLDVGGMEPADLFWLSLYNYTYDGFIPVNPEEIVAAARSIDEDNPEQDAIFICIDYMTDPDDFGKDEKLFMLEFIYQSMCKAISDAIFDKTMNH